MISQAFFSFLGSDINLHGPYFNNTQTYNTYLIKSNLTTKMKASRSQGHCVLFLCDSLVPKIMPGTKEMFTNTPCLGECRHEHQKTHNSILLFSLQKTEGHNREEKQKGSFLEFLCRDRVGERSCVEGAPLSMLPHVLASSRQEQRGEGHPKEPRREGPGSWAEQGHQDAAISGGYVPLPEEGRTHPSELHAWLCQTLTWRGSIH